MYVISKTIVILVILRCDEGHSPDQENIGRFFFFTQLSLFVSQMNELIIESIKIKKFCIFWKFPSI